jgi:Sulfotransferase family
MSAESSQHWTRHGSPRDAIFFWIPKTGGTTVYDQLVRHGCPSELWTRSKIDFDNTGVVTFGHMSVATLLEQGVISGEYFRRAFKFCIVRNPWERLVSLYHYRADQTDLDFDEFVRWLEDAFKRRAMLRNRIARRNRLALSVLRRLGAADADEEIPPVGAYNVKRWSQANPQVDWITGHRGDILVDHVGRFEDLETEVRYIFDRVGLRGESLAHRNRSEHRGWREYYSDATWSIVSDLYRRDIIAFEYDDRAGNGRTR